VAARDVVDLEPMYHRCRFSLRGSPHIIACPNTIPLVFLSLNSALGVVTVLCISSGLEVPLTTC